LIFKIHLERQRKRETEGERDRKRERDRQRERKRTRHTQIEIDNATPLNSKTVTNPYLIPRNFLFSPGAASSDSLVSDLTWLIAGTVDPSHQGRPKKEQTRTMTDTTKRSRW
jgi:hypothetical protein